jgi:hypothetical protein
MLFPQAVVRFAAELAAHYIDARPLTLIQIIKAAKTPLQAP